MYLFPFVFLVAMVFSIFIKNTKNSASAGINALWEREYAANSTPTKDITNLDYITISLNALPFLSNPSETIAECEKSIRALADCRILNLNGISNTDLKLQYGVANLSRLAQYDENYSSMQRTFSKWGKALADEGYKEEAVTVLEYALELGCDAKIIFLTLKKLYSDLNLDRTEQLILRVSLSQTPLKDSILAELKAM